MKRYGNLFDRICDLDNIREAHRNARKGKTGYRFFHGKTLIRRRIAYKFKKQMRKLRRNWHRLDPLTLLSSVMSYYGWVKAANAGRLFLTHVTPALRRRVLLRCGPTLEGALS